MKDQDQESVDGRSSSYSSSGLFQFLKAEGPEQSIPKKNEKFVLPEAAKQELINLSAAAARHKKPAGMWGTEDQTQAEATRESISKKLITLMEEDAAEFTDLDMSELLPSSPFQDDCFAKLQDFFEEAMADLATASKVGIPMDEIKEEFHFLWEGVKKSRKNLNDLQKTDGELSVEVGSMMVKTRNLIRVAENDPDTALRLGERLENAWNLVDVSEDEDRRNVSQIDEFKLEIVILNRNIQAAANMKKNDEVQEIYAIRKALQQERDTLKKELVAARTKEALTGEKMLRMTEKKVEFMETIEYCREEKVVQEHLSITEQDRKESIEKDIEIFAEKIETLTHELADVDKYNVGSGARVREMEGHIANQKLSNESAFKEAELAHFNLQRLYKDYETQIKHVEKLAVATYKKQKEMKQKEQELIKQRADGARMARQVTVNRKKVIMLKEHFYVMRKDMDALKLLIKDLATELEASKKKLDLVRRKVHGLDNSRTIVSRNFKRAEAVEEEQKHQLTVHMAAKRNLDMEMKTYKREIETQLETLHRLERQQEMYSSDSVKLAREVSYKLDEIKKMDGILFRFRKKLSRLEGKVKSKHQEYDQSLIERRFFENLLQSTGIEINAAVRRIRKKTSQLNRAILGYYEEQVNYEKEKAALEYLYRETEFFGKEAERVRKMASDMRRMTHALERERSLLGVQVIVTERELTKYRYYAKGATTRKENYFARLNKGWRELQQAWNDWRTLHSMVRMGVGHYRSLVAEITETRQYIQKLRKIQARGRKSFRHVNKLQQEISVLDICIAKEVCMINALEQELSKPINIHRWRVLEVMDPLAYKTVQRLNIVTKRVVDKDDEISKQCSRIEDKQRMYDDVRQAIKRLPSLESVALKQHFEAMFNEKREKFKKLQMDFNASGKQTQFYRNEVARINERMKQLKKDYLGKQEALWWQDKEPTTDRPADGTEHNYADFVREVKREFPIDRIISTENMDMDRLRENHKNNQLQQQAIEEFLNHRKMTILKKRKDPDYETREIYKENLARRKEEEESSAGNPELSSKISLTDLTNTTVKEAWQPLQSTHQLFQKKFPPIPKTVFFIPLIKGRNGKEGIPARRQVPKKIKFN